MAAEPMTPGEEAVEPGTVVVGLDRSPGGRAAVEFALRDAARRGVRVDAVTAHEPPERWAWSYVDLSHTGDPVADHQVAEHGAQDLIDDVRAELEPVLGPELPEVTVHVRCGRPSDVLTEVSRRAAVLVVGHRGRGALSSAVLGSVGLRCVLHASCPVTVVGPHTFDS